MGKILTSHKDIEKYIGMSLDNAKRYGFPIARFGRRVRANTDDLDRHVSTIATKQLSREQK